MPFQGREWKWRRGGGGTGFDFVAKKKHIVVVHVRESSGSEVMKGSVCFLIHHMPAKGKGERVEVGAVGGLFWLQVKRGCVGKEPCSEIIKGVLGL